MSVPPSGPPAGPPAGWPPSGRPSDRRAAVAPSPYGHPGAPGGIPAGWPGRRPAARPAPDWTPGRFHWGDAVVVLVYVALMVLGLGLWLAVSLGLVPGDLEAFDLVRDGFTVNIVSYTILVVLVLAVAWRPLVTSLRVFRTGTWWKLLLLPATWLACIVVNVIVLSLIGEAQTSANQAALEEMTTQAPPVLMILMTVVAAPLVEEYLFRHLLIGKLSRWINVWVCAVVSVLAFTLLHFLGTGGDFRLVETVPYLTLAVAITVSYILMGRSFGYAVLLHMVNNGIAIAMLYLVAPLLPDTLPDPTAPTTALAPLLALLG
ncbi:CPBP family intramembrane glutamic endopeptidase [Micrococcus luteus]|uniref:CPBP family intramembrane glutamic endopeptidase n=1 Tax=Micrococcus luteus TaxID=1270 RepID=UPI0011A76414|nr:CPBP family intramembrane glutamic endopeptidase [Micrococcus luteus]MCT2253362.1 CPBP family intramembrane metalloprotease [Micrococcus luteus]MCV7658799.1 CPBP family intramembrane metalloprotease [Micrococcus luteus]